MDSTLTAAALTVVAAVLTTLWSVGGRAALERRAMQQEVEVAAALPEGTARSQLIQVAEDRATLYVHRRIGSGHTARFHITMAAVLIVLLLLLFGLGSITDVGPVWLETIVDTAFLGVLILSGSAVALWVVESWRDHQASLRLIDLEAAKRRLAGLSQAGK